MRSVCVVCFCRPTNENISHNYDSTATLPLPASDSYSINITFACRDESENVIHIVFEFVSPVTFLRLRSWILRGAGLGQKMQRLDHEYATAVPRQIIRSLTHLRVRDWDSMVQLQHRYNKLFLVYLNLRISKHLLTFSAAETWFFYLVFFIFFFALKHIVTLGVRGPDGRLCPTRPSSPRAQPPATHAPVL